MVPTRRVTATNRSPVSPAAAPPVTTPMSCHLSMCPPLRRWHEYGRLRAGSPRRPGGRRLQGCGGSDQRHSALPDGAEHLLDHFAFRGGGIDGVLRASADPSSPRRAGSATLVDMSNTGPM